MGSGAQFKTEQRPSKFQCTPRKGENPGQPNGDLAVPSAESCRLPDASLQYEIPPGIAGKKARIYAIFFWHG